MNWESVLLGAIPGFLALAAMVYGKMQDRKAKREELDQTNQARKEPTWNELVTENRNLREEVSKQGEAIDGIKRDLERYKKSTNKKFSAFENVLRDIAAQWPPHIDPPVFNSEDLTELRDADIPWKTRIRSIATGTA